jgi:hypothetical protein
MTPIAFTVEHERTLRFEFESRRETVPQSRSRPGVFARPATSAVVRPSLPAMLTRSMSRGSLLSRGENA